VILCDFLPSDLEDFLQNFLWLNDLYIVNKKQKHLECSVSSTVPVRLSSVHVCHLIVWKNWGSER